jgi:hypothetical protein
MILWGLPSACLGSWPKLKTIRVLSMHMASGAIFITGDSRRAYIFFEYAKALQSDFINRIWLHQWDAKDRNIDIGREITCRIFILSGRTVREI